MSSGLGVHDQELRKLRALIFFLIAFASALTSLTLAPCGCVAYMLFAQPLRSMRSMPQSVLVSRSAHSHL